MRAHHGMHVQRRAEVINTDLSTTWRVSSSGIWHRVVRWVSTDVSEEHIASILRVEEIGLLFATTPQYYLAAHCPPRFRASHPVLVSYWFRGLVHRCWQFQPKDGPMATEFQSSDWLSILLATCLLAGLLNLFLRPWRWWRYVPPKRRLKLNGLHGVISQKMILFITTALRTSNPTGRGLAMGWFPTKEVLAPI
jgi:hypothetical protein